MAGERLCMADKSPLDVRACVFDAYGTLLDFGSAAERCSDVLGDQTNTLTTLWRDKQLQYTWMRALQGVHADFFQVTQDALEFSLETLGLDDPELPARLMDLYQTLDCFPEVPGVLAELKEVGLTTAILSNGTPKMLQASLAHSGIADLIDTVLSVEEVGVYKTDARVYQLAVDRLRVAPSQMTFMSSNGWDAHAAANFGMAVFWINRAGQPRERLPGTIYAELSDLSGLAERVCRQV